MINNKDIFILIKKLSAKSKFKNKIFILVFVVTFLIILIPFTFYKSIKDIAEDQKTYYYEGKMIRIYPGMTDEQFSKIANLAEEKDYVVRVDRYYSRAIESELRKGFDKNEGYLELAPLIPYNSPDEKLINYGRQVENDDEIICPSTMFFGSFDDVDLKRGLRTKEYVGDEIEIDLYIHEKDTNEKNIRYLNKKYKLVGTYDAAKPYSYNTCYISEKEYYERLSETELYRNYNPLGAIYIKNPEDRKKVGEILNREKIEYQEENLDYSFLTTTLVIAFIASLFLILFSTIILLVYIRKYIKENYKSLTLYKALGFNKKTIIKILFIETVALWIKAMIISIIITFIGGKILELLLCGITSYETLKIKLNLISIMIYFIIIIFISYIIIKSESNIIDKFTVIDLESKN